MSQEEDTAAAVDINVLDHPEMFKRLLAKKGRASGLPVRTSQVKISTKPENEDGFVEVTTEKPNNGLNRTSELNEKNETREKIQSEEKTAENIKKEKEKSNLEKWEEDEKQNEKKDDQKKEVQTPAVVTKENLTTEHHRQHELRGAEHPKAENAVNDVRTTEIQKVVESNTTDDTYTSVTSSDSDTDSSDTSPIPSPPPGDGHIHFKLPAVVVSGDSGHESDSTETDTSSESEASGHVIESDKPMKDHHVKPAQVTCDSLSSASMGQRGVPDGACAPASSMLRLSKRDSGIAIQEEEDDPTAEDFQPAAVITGEEPIRKIPIRQIFSNKKALRREIAKMDGMLKSMRRQRENLEYVYSVMWEWAEDLRNVERTKIGVPYFRAVKQTIAAQRKQMTEKYGEFPHRVKLLVESETPCFGNVHELIQNLKEFQTAIVRDERKYSAKNMEEMRHIIGEILGSTGTILEIFYEE